MDWISFENVPVVCCEKSGAKTDPVFGYSLRDERCGDRVFDQNRQGDHLAELRRGGAGGVAGAPGDMLEQLTLGRRRCDQKDDGGGVKRKRNDFASVRGADRRAFRFDVMDFTSTCTTDP